MPGSLHRVRMPSEQRALVEYVFATSELQEPDWLEWKGAYDLTEKSKRAATAKHLLGFANRMPDAALRHSEGYAYLLLGVEPGMYHGVPSHDAADVENWLSPYLGGDVKYDLHYVPVVDGKVVAILTVDPPRQGDPLHPLRKGGEDPDDGSVREGAVFVRKPGKTEQASSADIDRLTERARPAADPAATLALSVEAAPSVAALPGNAYNPELVEECIEHEQKRLIGQLPPPPVRLGASSFSAFSGVTSLDGRSRQAFREEVAEYLAAFRDKWEDVMLTGVLAISDPLVFRATNPTEDNFESVQVEARLPVPTSRVFLDWDETEDRLDVPREPRRFGRLFPIVTDYASMIGKVRPVLSVKVLPDGDGARLVFPPVHLRPLETVTLGGVLIVIGSNNDDETSSLPVSWRATSTSTRGAISGELAVDIVPSADLVVSDVLPDDDSD